MVESTTGVGLPAHGSHKPMAPHTPRSMQHQQCDLRALLTLQVALHSHQTTLSSATLMLLRAPILQTLPNQLFSDGEHEHEEGSH